MATTRLQPLSRQSMKGSLKKEVALGEGLLGRHQARRNRVSPVVGNRMATTLSGSPIALQPLSRQSTTSTILVCVCINVGVYEDT